MATIALASVGVLTAGALAYAVYFDYRRRNDAEFRKHLRKQHKKVSRAKEEEAKASERSQKDKIKRVVEEANEEGFPKDPEETEGYFMHEVARGEGMCTDGSDPVDAALCFHKALKVYEEVRRDRAYTLVDLAAQSGRSLHLGEGEAKKERDQMFAALKEGKGPVPDKW